MKSDETKIGIWFDAVNIAAAMEQNTLKYGQSC